DARYLVGVALALMVLTAAGTAAWCATLSRPGLCTAARLVLIALTIVAVGAAPAILPSQVQPRRLELVPRAGARLVVAACLAPGLGPAATAVGPLVPALAFVGVGLARVAGGSGTRDQFQEGQVVRARNAVESVVPPGAIVITTPALGRPAENITHYTHAEAHYAGEFALLGTDPAEAARHW